MGCLFNTIGSKHIKQKRMYETYENQLHHLNFEVICHFTVYILLHKIVTYHFKKRMKKLI